MTLMSPLVAAPTPEEDLGWVSALMGTPLKILIIILVATVVLVILRRLIKNLTEKIASGENLNSKFEKSKFISPEVTQVLNLASPLATARKAQRSRTIGSVLRSTVTLVVGLIATLMVLEQLGINTVPLLTSAGVAGVALGFGAQSLVKDFLSGTFMILEDQFGVGDRVIVGDVTGTVESVALRTTKVRDDEGTLWFLRNGEMLRVGNRNQGWAMSTVEVSVPYDSDLGKVREALQAAIEKTTSVPRLSKGIMGTPQISGIESMTAAAVTLRITARTQPGISFSVSQALREEIRAQFAHSGLALG